jgi:hypothetical protein
MSTALEAASLIMIPTSYSDGLLASAKPNDGAGDFTFSRGSNISATRVNVDGYIEKGYENLLLQSNTFDTTWANINSTETSGQQGYDGDNNAWLLESTQDGSSSFVYQSVSQSGVQTFSVYAKAGTADYLAIYVSTGARAWFNLSNGTIGYQNSTIDKQIQDVGNGWYRCSISYNASVSDVRFYIADANNSFNSVLGSSVFIQDAMLNQGLVAYPYVETTTAPVAAGILEDMPRIDFSEGNQSLLLEPSRTNLVPYSEYLNGLTLKTDSLEMNTEDTKSPEDVYNASKFDFTSGTRYFGNSIGTANDAVFSVFAKAGNHDFVQFVTSSTASFAINFDLSNGSSNVIGTAPSELEYDIEDYGNGWYRIWVYRDNGGANASNYWWVVDSLTSSRASNVSTSGNMYYYGLQVEQDATYPTSYIPTYGVSQTRLAESISATGLGNYLGDSEGTLYIEAEQFQNTGFVSIIETTNSGVSMGVTGGNTFLFNVRVTGTNQADIPSGAIFTANTNFKLAGKYKTNDFEFFKDGASVGTDTSGTTFGEGDLITVQSNSAFASDQPFYGRIKKIIIFPTALSDEECITLTTI